MMLENKASDLHLIAGQVPGFRINGELERLPGTVVLENQVLHEMLNEINRNEVHRDIIRWMDERIQSN